MKILDMGRRAGIRNLYNKINQKYLNITREDIKQFIIKQGSYQLTKEQEQVINKPIIGKYPNQRWAVDLIDMEYYSGHNNNKKYVMTVIDFFI